MLLSACGGSGSTDSSGAVDGKGQTLDVLVNVNSAYPEEQKNWMTDIAAKFKQQTGAELKFETFASANDELTKIQTSV
ncbi:ABC transporter substrate-binding protein, partial [Actinomadura sp. DSM 109109]|nr:ABC transporter substrate-binding protein [Actinomadura lepetitiana]